MSPTPTTVRRLLRWMGVVMLAGGLGTAVSIWLPQDRLERRRQAQKTNEFAPGRILGPLAPEDSRRYTRDVELYYGKSGVLMDKVMRAMEEWGEGKQLAWTVGLVSVMLAGAMFFVAGGYRPAGARPRAQPGGTTNSKSG